MRIGGTLAACALCWCATLLGADPDPFIGKWKLNWDKSLSSEARPKSAIRTYKRSGDGVRVAELWVYQDGKRTQLDYVAAYDGKDYPVRTGPADVVSFTRPDLHTVVGASKKNGNVTYTFKRVVSQAGNTLTIQLTSTDGPAETSTTVLVYDRVK